MSVYERTWCAGFHTPQLGGAYPCTHVPRFTLAGQHWCKLHLPAPDVTEVKNGPCALPKTDG